MSVGCKCFLSWFASKICTPGSAHKQCDVTSTSAVSKGSLMSSPPTNTVSVFASTASYTWSLLVRTFLISVQTCAQWCRAAHQTADRTHRSPAQGTRQQQQAQAGGWHRLLHSHNRQAALSHSGNLKPRRRRAGGADCGFDMPHTGMHKHVWQGVVPDGF